MSYWPNKARQIGSRSPRTPVHLLDDDSLLIIFVLCRPVIMDEFEADDVRILGGGVWIRERWWHRLIQVCRRWRYLILESAFHLQVSLVCGRGTPVADMLAHYPPFPLIIDHIDESHGMTTEDMQGILLALQHRDRVRRIRIMKPIPILQELIVALDGDFPVLEYVFAFPSRYQWYERNMSLNLPDAFRAPHLRHLVLMNFANPIESPLLTTMGNLVTLSLNAIPASAHFHPNTLLQLLSLMPQLETVGITFNSYNPSRDAERQLLRTPITTRVILPNLRWLGFKGTNAYLEALLPWVTTPLIEKIQIYFFNRMIYSTSHLRQFMNTAGNLRLKIATFTFSENHLNVKAYPYEGAKMYTLYMELGGKHFDWQVVSAAQVFPALKTVFSAVEYLIIGYDRFITSSEWDGEADRTQWRELLGPFSNVKSLRVGYGLVGKLSRVLQPGEGESPTELLPELQELSHSTGGARHNAFTLFVDARQKAGHPVTVRDSLETRPFGEIIGQGTWRSVHLYRLNYYSRTCWFYLCSTPATVTTVLIFEGIYGIKYAPVSLVLFIVTLATP